MEKSILEMVGGVKHINPHYDIKAESSSCYNINEGFTGIEANGVRFSNIGEMLCYMNKQREQLIKAKKIIKDLCGMVRELNKPNVQLTDVDYSLSEAEQFLGDMS